MNRPKRLNCSGRPRSKRGEAASICFTPPPPLRVPGSRVNEAAYEKGRAWAVGRAEGGSAVARID
jgi:hypothetical protein